VLLAVKFDAWFAGITGIALNLFYIFFTVSPSWRTQFRRRR
jgi:ATP-binding cassette subfamily B protein